MTTHNATPHDEPHDERATAVDAALSVKWRNVQRLLEELANEDADAAHMHNTARFDVFFHGIAWAKDMADYHEHKNTTAPQPDPAPAQPSAPAVAEYEAFDGRTLTVVVPPPGWPTPVDDGTQTEAAQATDSVNPDALRTGDVVWCSANDELVVINRIYHNRKHNVSSLSVTGLKDKDKYLVGRNAFFRKPTDAELRDALKADKS